MDNFRKTSYTSPSCCTANAQVEHRSTAPRWRRHQTWGDIKVTSPFASERLPNACAFRFNYRLGGRPATILRLLHWANWQMLRGPSRSHDRPIQGGLAGLRSPPAISRWNECVSRARIPPILPLQTDSRRSIKIQGFSEEIPIFFQCFPCLAFLRYFCVFRGVYGLRRWRIGSKNSVSPPKGPTMAAIRARRPANAIMRYTERRFTSGLVLNPHVKPVDHEASLFFISMFSLYRSNSCWNAPLT